MEDADLIAAIPQLLTAAVESFRWCNHTHPNDCALHRIPLNTLEGEDDHEELCGSMSAD